MNSYNSSLTNTYSERQTLPLSRSEHTAINKENRPVSESLREGQQLRGEVINRTTTDVTIRLSGGQTLQARLDASVPLSIGQSASFEVTHADPALISLRILQDEAAFAQNALIQKALNAAELPFTDRNAELVNTLLQHNLPISKESILSLIRQSNTYPNADLNTLALLTQHKLPVTQAALTQFEAYQNYEHQLLPRLENLAYSLAELASSTDSSLPGLTAMLQEFFAPTDTANSNPQMFTGTAPNLSNAEGLLTQSPTSDTTLQPFGAESGVTAQPFGTESGITSLPFGAESGITSLPFGTESGVSVSTQLSGNTPAETATGSSVLSGAAQASSGTDALGSEDTQSQAPQPAPSAPVAGSPKTAPADTAYLSGSKEPLTGTPTVSSAAADIPQNHFVRQLLSRWTLSPSDLADPEKVKDFYRRLREDLDELQSALRFAQKDKQPDSPLERLLSDTASATRQLQDNLEFMNMLNRIFPYVQLPIRFSDKTAHGELYVYTKKEKLRSESGSISVLLHLDMEALGPTDIYLSLTGNELSSRFYLNDTSQEPLFLEHLPELKETLTKKGFSVNFELIPRRQEEDPVRDFLNSHDTSGLSRFTFDCRA